MTGPNATPPGEQQDPAAYWEDRYTGADRVWSGRANAALQTEAAALSPSTALDLGCGEGGDTAWMAEHGWQVTALDIASSAITRAQQLATERGIPADRIRWQVTDLATWQPDGHYDLVSACFLHSPVTFPRTQVLRRAAGAVAPGGHLLVVSHAAPPPWAHDGHTPLPDEAALRELGLFTASEQLAALELPAAQWDILVCEDRPRPTTGPDGQPATLDDAVILAQHRAQAHGTR